ncbi:MAG: sugar phosphate isomerase/epimerase [Planctomycetota bacterium]|nr:MAG: sugar phosphate isomerase/epimerase [Planctomycetota bacterium]
MNPRAHTLDRRTLLASGAAAFALAGLRAPEPPRKLKKAVMIGMCGDGATILEKFEILRDAGFDGAELDSPSALKRDDVLAAMQKTGIAVHGLVDSVHWSVPLNSRDAGERKRAIDALNTALEDGAAYGSTSVLLVPCVVDQRRPYDEAWKLSQECIRACLPTAARCKVAIAIENVWNSFLLSPLEAARYVDEFESPWVRFHFDIGNVIHYGWPEQWIRILGSRIAKLHVKDYSRELSDKHGKWKGFDADLLDGDAGWPEVMKALDEIGYTRAADVNWWTAETAGGDRKRMKAIAEKMDRILKL